MTEKTLIVSISGIRGVFGAGLDPRTIVRFAEAFGHWCRRRAAEAGRAPLVVVGRDGRVTGPLCSALVVASLESTGCDVLDVGLATTPTVEVAVQGEGAVGGVVLSASHNPAEWNALKLLNHHGEFLTAEEGAAVLALAESDRAFTVGYADVGTRSERDYLDAHLDRILALDAIAPERIAARGFRVVVDGINSVGAVAVPRLLARLGLAAEAVHVVNAEPNGHFAHAPEPLPENLTGTMEAVRTFGADLGLVVDPDVDRLALIDGQGRYVSEELTQVIAADFWWRHHPGPFVTNLSSSRAIEEVAARYGQAVHRAAVGEAHVVAKMKEVGAVLGGEGNGGVIVPALHYGRDALAGIAIVLQHLADTGQTLAEVHVGLPRFTIVKRKRSVEGLDPERLLADLAGRYAGERITTIDGVKIDFDEGWVHLRRSNTEPIVRVYAEARTAEAAEALAERFMEELASGRA